MAGWCWYRTFPPGVSTSRHELVPARAPFNVACSATTAGESPPVVAFPVVAGWPVFDEVVAATVVEASPVVVPSDVVRVVFAAEARTWPPEVPGRTRRTAPAAAARITPRATVRALVSPVTPATLEDRARCGPARRSSGFRSYVAAILAVMTFGQQAGPPASARQLQELLGLLQEAGHRDFRDARGPLGFTQRQAAGKFTREEVSEFIERLQEDEVAVGAPDPPARQIGPTEAAAAMRDVPADCLAAELRRRGWIVIEP